MVLQDRHTGATFSQVVAEVVRTDTRWWKLQETISRICAADSTKKGYTMQLVNTDVWQRDSTSVKGRMTLEAARMALGTKVLFSTDEMGGFQEIINWKDLYKNALNYQDKLVNRIFYRYRALCAPEYRRTEEAD